MGAAMLVPDISKYSATSGRDGIARHPRSGLAGRGRSRARERRRSGCRARAGRAWPRGRCAWGRARSTWPCVSSVDVERLPVVDGPDGDDLARVAGAADRSVAVAAVVAGRAHDDDPGVPERLHLLDQRVDRRPARSTGWPSERFRTRMPRSSLWSRTHCRPASTSDAFPLPALVQHAHARRGWPRERCRPCGRRESGSRCPPGCRRRGSRGRSGRCRRPRRESDPPAGRRRCSGPGYRRSRRTRPASGCRACGATPESSMAIVTPAPFSRPSGAVGAGSFAVRRATSIVADDRFVAGHELDVVALGQGGHRRRREPDGHPARGAPEVASDPAAEPLQRAPDRSLPAPAESAR